jgi:hypothetical protein
VGNKRKNFPLAVFLVLAILIAGAFFVLWNPASPPAVKMPVPDGYTAFVQAGSMVQKQTGDFATMDPAGLSYVVDANSNALQIARSGLGEKSRVPVGYSTQYISDHLTDLSRMKMLAFAFLAEGRQAELDRRTNDAVNSYLDATRLGINSREGGNLIDVLVGIAVEAMGTSELQKHLRDLDAKTSAELARQLEVAYSDKESWEEFLQNEKNWSRQAFPGVQYRIAELFTTSETKASRTKAKQRYEAQQNKTRRLMLDLAAHAYQLDKGHPPANVADLVQDYLKAAPVDPLTGKQMTLMP